MIEPIYTPGDQAENLISTRRGVGYDEALVGSLKESGRNGLYFLSLKRVFKLINYLFLAAMGLHCSHVGFLSLR